MARRRMYGSATSAISIADMHPGVHAQLLQRVLHGERVQHRRQHARVVGGGPVHAARPPPACRAGCCRRRRRWRSPRRSRCTACDGPRDRGDALRVLAVVAIAHQRLAGELQQDAGERPAPSVTRPRPGTRANRLTSMFSPIRPDSSARSCSIVLPSCSGRIDGCSEQHEVDQRLAPHALGDLVEHLLGLAVGRRLGAEDLQLGGLEARPRSPRPTRTAATGGRDLQATSRANALNCSLRATKSVSQPTSTSAPIGRRRGRRSRSALRRCRGRPACRPRRCPSRAAT